MRPDYLLPGQTDLEFDVPIRSVEPDSVDGLDLLETAVQVERGQSQLRFAGPRCAEPSVLLDGLEPGGVALGLSDGRWSVIDMLAVLVEKLGRCALTINTWTISLPVLGRLWAMQQEGHLWQCRFALDRSYPRREPDCWKSLLAGWGPGAVRIANLHGKFCVLSGADGIDALLLGSANLNANRRIETWTVVYGGEAPGQFLEVVDRLFRLQPPGDTVGRRDTAAEWDALLGPPVYASDSSPADGNHGSGLDAWLASVRSA